MNSIFVGFVLAVLNYFLSPKFLKKPASGKAWVIVAVLFGFYLRLTILGFAFYWLKISGFEISKVLITFTVVFSVLFFLKVRKLYGSIASF